MQASTFGDGCNNPFKCPPKTFAGGRKPRVKSNIKARKRNFWNPRKDRIIKRRKQVRSIFVVRMGQGISWLQKMFG